ncbi:MULTISPECIES: branched-chain amino acid ABC transporter permease [Variovorax]|jgi:branched-chain amino acid transport system permease protein|uniref:branched-chain amino acid ABC transporter permease n=1 Tax=Variovorax TaxID=34072 RepID=UPI00086CA780|nr:MULTISPECIES: branched-chain amino acid ABC transporter permease [Variovorax]MBN8754563.1 branched-chain amino acid ABC transporter permease [Variovorax sp.]ODU19291.1 MAG: branched-chain amino acid ABC transporter permease [Variovorax sp. SCN 67-85]ODV25194.1 MAG: branched-chain amino acid ABC transporter permease [Variovorax sp. SCN 67-20]OJZ03012.1 MAG: branched-chain amino acid ABC transporter permease [Variovorax sp. 67-131]UKI07520.1 branched-chain amino acid ABC transporter permease 
MNASRLRALGATALILAVLPFLLPNNFMLDIAIRIAFAAVAVIGLNLLMGFAGQISIGHAGFLAIGAYGSAIATSRFGWPPLIAIAAAGIASAILAWLVAKPMLRLKGHSLTMATLGFGVIVNIVLINEVAVTGGPDGMAVPPLEVAGLALTDLRHWYAGAAIVLWLAILLSLNLYDSPCGRALRGLHGSEVAARVVGVDVALFKTRAFVMSAVMASVSGSLTGHYVGFISPQMASFAHSVELATMVVLGGMASTFGAVLGSAVLTMLPQLLGGLHGYESILFGLILMLTMMFLPRGIVPTLALKLRRKH